MARSPVMAGVHVLAQLARRAQAAGALSVRPTAGVKLRGTEGAQRDRGLRQLQRPS
jgi:hypothetical protein